MTPTKLPRCDCLNECGDDPAVLAGRAAKCENYDTFRSEEMRRLAMRELSEVLRSAHALELIGNGLVHMMRTYPDQKALCQRLISLCFGRI
jgi:hypothetical protein